MALSTESTQKVKASFNEIFPNATPKIWGEKADGTSEAVRITVEEINRYQLLALGELCNQVPESFSVRRSGTGLAIGFY